MRENKLRFGELFRLSLRTFRVKPIRAILTVAGMSVGIGAVLFLVSLGYGLQFILIGKLVTTEDSLITMEVSFPSESNKVIDRTELDSLKQIPEASEVSPVYVFPGEISSAGGSGLLVDARIVEGGYFRLSGTSPDIGNQLLSQAGESGVVISSQALKAIGMKADSSSLAKALSLKIFYQDPQTLVSDESDSLKPLPITGIIADDNQAPLVIVLPVSISKAPPFALKALVKAKDINTVEKLRDVLIGKGYLVSARIDLVNQARKIMNIITIVLGVFGITALIVSAIGMFNTMIVGFMERIYEVGILKSIGATDNDVRNLFLMEACMMGIFGGVGGIALGMGGGKLVNIALSVLATRLGGKPFELFITPYWFVLLILGLSVLIGLISGFWPAYRASGLSPKEAFARK